MHLSRQNPSLFTCEKESGETAEAAESPETDAGSAAREDARPPEHWRAAVPARRCARARETHSAMDRLERFREKS